MLLNAKIVHATIQGLSKEMVQCTVSRPGWKMILTYYLPSNQNDLLNQSIVDIQFLFSILMRTCFVYAMENFPYLVSYMYYTCGNNQIEANLVVATFVTG